MTEERVASRRRHSAELRALVLAQGAAPRTSVAKVAMLYGLNANLVHGWRMVARERGAGDARPTASPAILSAKPVAGVPQFVPVSPTPSPSVSGPPPVDIRTELRRGATGMKITWPIAAAAECAARMRELLR